MNDEGKAVVRLANVVFFEIGADDPEATAIFYARVFGWKIEPDTTGAQYWYVTTGDDDAPGIDGGLCFRLNELTSTVNTFEVSSLDDAARRITEEGGKVLAPKTSIPGEGYVQYCHDIEGNVFGIAEFDVSAT
jgi:predicted enzyme related to lactoylglutathione lyase